MTTPSPYSLDENGEPTFYFSPTVDTPTYQGVSGRNVPGVPSDYSVDIPGTTKIRPGATGVSGVPSYVRQYFEGYGRTAYPQYTEGTEYSAFAYLAPEEIARIQEALVSANLLDPADVPVSGVWNPDSAIAMRDVLNWADWTGKQWGTVLADWAANPIIPDDQTKKYVPSVYAAPDYDTIVMDVKDTFKAKLGRDPRDDELTALASKMSGFYAEQYAAYEQARQTEFERSQAGETTAAPTVEQVDPDASFRAFFENQYKPELDTIKLRDRFYSTAPSVQASLGTLDI